jgi:hypothetical protein
MVAAHQSMMGQLRAADEDGACSHVGSVEPDPSVVGIVQAIAGAGKGNVQTMNGSFGEGSEQHGKQGTQHD